MGTCDVPALTGEVGRMLLNERRLLVALQVTNMENSIEAWLATVFGGDLAPHPLSVGQSAARALLIFIAGIVLVRIGKSRLIGSMTPVDVLLAVILGSLLSRGINGSASMSSTIAACAALVAVHWVLTELTVRWHTFGNLVKGHSRLVVDQGRIDWAALRKSHLSEHDLLEELRLNANEEDLQRIEKAYKERNGRVSGVRRPPEPRVIDVTVEDGVKTVRIEWR